jgi:hypothetical protein
MASESEQDTAPPSRRLRTALIACAVVVGIAAVFAGAFWFNRSGLAEVAIIDTLERNGFTVKQLTVSKADTDGLVIENIHLSKFGDIRAKKLTAVYSFDGIKSGKIDSFVIEAPRFAPPGKADFLTAENLTGKAVFNPDDIFDGSQLTAAFKGALAGGKTLHALKAKLVTKGGKADADFLAQADLSRIQIFAETNFRDPRHQSKISVEGLIYLKETLAMLDIVHPATGWVTVKGDVNFKGIQAFFGAPQASETLEAEGEIKLRGRQLASVGFSEALAGPDRLTLRIINMRATPKAVRTRFNLYAYVYGRASNFFTFQNAKLNIEGVAKSNRDEARLQIERGNLAIDLPIYIGDLFLRDQVEVGLASLKNYLRYDFRQKSYDYSIKLQPLPLFVSVPTHRATVRTDWEFGQVSAEGDSRDRHNLNVAINSIRIPTYALEARDIDLTTVTKNDETDFRLDVDKFEQTVATPVVVPLTLRATAKKIEKNLKGEMVLSAPITGFKMTGDFDHDFESFKGAIRYRLPDLELGAKGEPIANLSPLLASQLKVLSGRISAEGDYRWQVAQKPDGKLSLDLKNLVAAGDGARLTGINTKVELSSLNPPATATPQTLNGLLYVGEAAPMPLDVKWRLLPKGGLSLEPFMAKVAGGTLSVDSKVLVPLTPRDSFTVGVDKVDLSEIFKLVGLDGLTGTGQLSGSLPLVIENNSVSIEKGRLDAAGSGVIRLSGGKVTEALKQKGDTVAMAIEALSNFHYKKLSIGLDKGADGNGRLSMRLEGANPKVQNGYPFVFNINLESNFDNLAIFAIKGLQTADNVLKWAGGRYGLEVRNPRTGKKLR